MVLGFKCVRPLRDPHGLLMEFVGQGQQHSADRVEDEPGEDESAGTLKDGPKAELSARLRLRFLGDLLEAGSADDPVIVLGDTFPAVELAAFRTASHGLTRGVIQAALEDKGGHYCAAGSTTLGAWAASISGRNRARTRRAVRTRLSEGRRSVC